MGGSGMKHTPGPWILSDDGDGCIELYLSEKASVSAMYRTIHRIELYDALEEAGGDYGEGLKTVIAAAASAELFAKDIGYPVSFSEESIKSLACTLLIGMGRAA
jgi:hypothetical protein